MKAWASIGVIIILIILALCPMISFKGIEASGPDDESWSMFRGDSRRTGLSQFSTEGNEGGLLWTSGDNGLYFHSYSTSPAIDSSDNIYATSDDPNGIYSIDNMGNERWFYGTEGRCKSTPALDIEGNVYFSAGEYFLSLNRNGSLNWQFKMKDGTASSPVISADGTIYFGSYDQNLYALYPNGSLRWNVTTEAGIESSPAVDQQGTIYIVGVLNDEYRLLSFYPDSALKWTFMIEDAGLHQSPSIDDNGVIYCYNGRNLLYAIYPDGTEKWRYNIPHGSQTESLVIQPAIGPEGIIYSGSKDGVYALKPDGSLKWKRDMRSDTFSPIISAEGTIYVTSESELWAIDGDGDLKWRYNRFTEVYESLTGQPVIGSDGTIYIMSTSSLYAINGEPTIMGIPQSIIYIILIILVVIVVVVIVLRIRKSKGQEVQR